MRGLKLRKQEGGKIGGHIRMATVHLQKSSMMMQ